jgi:riboflavin synthase
VFTGITQAQGIMQPLGSDRFSISLPTEGSHLPLSDLAMGDSVAVDGVCLTVEEVSSDGFVATASPETLRRTSLGQRSQAYVNLETSLRVGSKLGGHFVLGHVDGVGCLIESVPTEKAWEMSFAAPASLSEQWQHQIARYLVPKGSIAVNGISLTVAACDAERSWFKVAVIPLTYADTNLAHLEIGSWVNLESDLLGKYVDQLLSSRSSANDSSEEISMTFLAENGYL